MSRGVRAWSGESADLFGQVPPAPPPAPTPPPAGQHRRYSDRENRKLERVLPAFVAWLHGATIAELERAKIAQLVVRFAPMQDWDVEQMLHCQLVHRARKAKR